MRRMEAHPYNQHFSDGTGDVVQRKGYNNANDEDVREGPSEEASQS